MLASGESLSRGRGTQKKEYWRQCPVFQSSAGQGLIVKSLKKEGKENNAKWWGWVNTQERWETCGEGPRGWGSWRTAWSVAPTEGTGLSGCFTRSSNIDISVLHFQFLLSQLTDLPTHTPSVAIPLMLLSYKSGLTFPLLEKQLWDNCICFICQLQWATFWDNMKIWLYMRAQRIWKVVSLSQQELSSPFIHFTFGGLMPPLLQGNGSPVDRSR